MPAAWIADRFPAVYNFRAPGRLASLLSLFLMIESVRHLSLWNTRMAIRSQGNVSGITVPKMRALILGLAIIHVIEIFPFLKPIASQPLHPVSGAFSIEDVERLRQLGKEHQVVLVSPSVRVAEVNWTAHAFALVYYSGLRSNLYYLARTIPDHDTKITTGINRIANGEWEPFLTEYGSNTLFAIPSALADKLRSRMTGNFEETLIGPLSIWAKRKDVK
jgi:hypothetical protein